MKLHTPTHTLNLDRRTVLQGLFLGMGAAAMPMWMREARAAAGGPELDLPSGPLANIGPVVAQPLTSGAIMGVDDMVMAPEGFTVRCVARAGVNPVTGMADTGYLWHVNPDGGAVFPATDGGWVYTSNSESTPGGVGAIRFAADGTITSAYRILDNTRNNCAGGATPWGTWLSCEETANGEVFECDPFGTAATAVKKPALGAFPHEAVAIDPINHVCYQTEDGGSQRFWRFVTNASDRTVMPNGVTRLALTSGTLQVLNVDGFANGGNPTDAQLREAKRATWVTVPTAPVVPGAPALPQQPPTSTTNGTVFSGGEGIWYYEIPPALRTVPMLGTVPTRGVIFFTTKGTNRVHAYDIENQLIELIFDNSNMQITVGFDDVDNLVVSPAGDVLVAEDGNAMRLYVIVPNKPAKLLMQITKGGSEICGPAFTPDGSRLYFSSQRGPSGPTGNATTGATYELTIPPQFRTLMAAPAPTPATPSPSPGTPSPSPATPSPSPATPSPAPAPVVTPAPAATVVDANGGRFGGGSMSLGGGLLMAASLWLKRVIGPLSK